MKKKLFKLSDINITNVKGERIAAKFDQEEIGDVIYNNSNSINMDNFARSIHARGEALVSIETLKALPGILKPFYKFRALSAIELYIQDLFKKEGDVAEDIPEGELPEDGSAE